MSNGQNNNASNDNSDFNSGNIIEGYTKEKLYNLIPAVYRQQDSKLGKPLNDLLDILYKNVTELENDIANLYDNWFIQTCDEWVTSYIADLVGAKSLDTSMVSSSSTTENFSQREYIANTIRYRRRKGNLLMMEELAGTVTNWGARAVEFFKLLGKTQNLNHLRLENYQTPDLRDASTLELLNTPFDSISHTVEVRRIRSNRGLYNIPNIGIFLWRLEAFPSYDTLASPYFEPGEIDNSASSKFRFNPLGYDEPLFTRPADAGSETSTSRLKMENDLPIPIRRRGFYNMRDNYYGKNLSIFVRVKYVGESDYQEIATRDIQVCDLEKWHQPCAGKVAIDPQNGRMSLPKKATQVRVRYHYGFGAKMGGGFYNRSSALYGAGDSYLGTAKIFRISKNGAPDNYDTVKGAIDAWLQEDEGCSQVSFLILDSEIYDEPLSLSIPVKCKLAIAAASAQRPILRSLEIEGGTGSSLILDGIWFNNTTTGEPVIKVNPGDMSSLVIQHCTLAPGQDTTVGNLGISLRADARRFLCTWEKIKVDKTIADGLKEFLKKNFAHWIKTDKMNFTINDDGDKITLSEGTKSLAIVIDENGAAAHLEITEDGKTIKNVYEFILVKESGMTNLYVKGGNDNLQLSLDRSITGRIQLTTGQSEAQLNSVDSIIDGKGDSKAIVFDSANLINTTVFGKTQVNKLKLASNVIFTDTVTSTITQEGCARFSYIPAPESKTPRRYMCQPPSEVKDQISSVRPSFTSDRYGDPGYAQLDRSISTKIFQGADNDAEMGAFNHLFEPQRLADLRSTFDEYLRFGLEPGVFLVT